MRYSNIQESFFDFLKFVDKEEEARITKKVDYFFDSNPGFLYDSKYNLPGICPIERISQSLAINETKLKKVLKKIAEKTNKIGITRINSSVWSGDVVLVLDKGDSYTGGSKRKYSYKSSQYGKRIYDSYNYYANESFLSSLKSFFGFDVEDEEYDESEIAIAVNKFLFDVPVYDFHKKSGTPGLIFLSMLAEEEYTDVPFKQLKKFFKTEEMDNCDIIEFSYKDIEGPLVIFGKPAVSRLDYLTQGTSDFEEMLLIREVQKKLIGRGASSVVPSGEFDANTSRAIEKFQRDNKINASRLGEIDLQTLKKLRVDLSFLNIKLSNSSTDLITKLKKEAERQNIPVDNKRVNLNRDINIQIDQKFKTPDDIYTTSKVDNQPEYFTSEPEYYDDINIDIEQEDEDEITTHSRFQKRPKEDAQQIIRDLETNDSDKKEFLSLILDGQSPLYDLFSDIGSIKQNNPFSEKLRFIYNQYFIENKNIKESAKRKMFRDFISKYLDRNNGLFFNVLKTDYTNKNYPDLIQYLKEGSNLGIIKAHIITSLINPSNFGIIVQPSQLEDFYETILAMLDEIYDQSKYGKKPEIFEEPVTSRKQDIQDLPSEYGEYDEEDEDVIAKEKEEEFDDEEGQMTFFSNKKKQ